MNNWKKTTLGEIAKNVSRRFNFSKKEKVVFVNTGDVQEGKFLHKNFSKTEGLPGQAKKALKKGDILLSEIRPINNRYALVDFEADNYVVSTKFMVISGNEQADSKFLYLFLTSKQTLQEFQVIAESRSGTFPQITFDSIANFPILLPPLPEQREIAEVLSSLDDKIELLRKQNETLEKIAQGIFKEWFVNFTIDGKKLKLKNGVPEGWGVGKLGDEFSITIGRTPPRGESEWFSIIPTGKKWISIKDMGNNEVYISHTSEYLTDEAVKKFNIPIIPDNTTILSFKMTVGRLAITTEEMLSNEAIAHLKIRENSNLSTEFIYSFLKGLEFNSLGSTSSIVTAINSTMIKEIKVLVPEKEIMQKYSKVIHPIFAKLKINNSQIQTLSRLRDTLLPKLMSGRIVYKEKYDSLY